MGKDQQGEKKDDAKGDDKMATRTETIKKIKQATIRKENKRMETKRTEIKKTAVRTGNKKMVRTAIKKLKTISS